MRKEAGFEVMDHITICMQDENEKIAGILKDYTDSDQIWRFWQKNIYTGKI